MGDEEGEVKVYAYEGARAEGETIEAEIAYEKNEESKSETKSVTLLGPREGEGSSTFPNGDTYKGAFVAGLRSGEGVYTYAAPPVEEGEDSKPPVATYEGKWKEGAKAGVGVMTFASGAKYHGSFSGGKFSGQGTLFYANGDIFTGEWVAGKKHGMGTYLYAETGAKVSGLWCKNILVEGGFVDKYGNTYTGAFAADTTSAKFVPGGTFSLASGATAELPLPGAPAWETQFGNFVQFKCKRAAAATSMCSYLFTSQAEYVKLPYFRCSEVLGKLTTSFTPPYKPLPGVDPETTVAFLDLYSSKSVYDDYVATGAIKAALPKWFEHGATGDVSDFTALQGPMHTLEKPGFSSGANHVIMICCLAKSEEAAAQMVEVAKSEIAANMVEPLFVRGTVIPPTPEEPKKVQWTVQWASAAGVAAHRTFEHHKAAGPKIFPLVDMAWGGALEYDQAYHFAH